MPSIDDFVNHRFADAKEKLRKLDPDYVGDTESIARLENLGLRSPLLPVDQRSPKRGLSTEWQRLLEDCHELSLQASIVQTAADYLIGDSDIGISSAETGRRFHYHMQSWYIHADTLADRTTSVIRKTIDLYESDGTTAKAMSERYESTVYDKVTKLVREERNQFGHGTTRSLGKAITEDGHWEGTVALGLTPSLYFDLIRDAEEWKELMTSAKDSLRRQNTTAFDMLGGILNELEQDLAHKKIS